MEATRSSRLEPRSRALLLRTAADVEAMMAQIQRDKAAADETRVVVVREEAIASAKAAECQGIKDSAFDGVRHSSLVLTAADLRRVINGDEFEQLSDTFNSMLGSLSEQQTQLRSINRSLDLKLGNCLFQTQTRGQRKTLGESDFNPAFKIFPARHGRFDFRVGKLPGAADPRLRCGHRQPGRAQVAVVAQRITHGGGFVVKGRRQRVEKRQHQQSGIEQASHEQDQQPFSQERCP
jgi:hypothetical protein